MRNRTQNYIISQSSVFAVLLLEFSGFWSGAVKINIPLGYWVQSMGISCPLFWDSIMKNYHWTSDHWRWGQWWSATFQKIKISLLLCIQEVMGPNLVQRLVGWIFLWFYSFLPDKCWPTATSFKTLLNSLFTDHPILSNYTRTVTDSVIK